jgi:ribose transport system ATP-binding protein
MKTLKLKSISKKFPGVEALKDFSFSIEPGKIYGLVGENGAGKSTLVKILMGLYQPNGGDIYQSGEKIVIKNPFSAIYDHGIDAVFQDHPLIPHLSIAENVFLDKLQDFYQHQLIDNKRLQEQAFRVLTRVGLELDVAKPCGETSEAEKSLIDFAKALSHDPQILILDEITAPLVSGIVEDLFEILRDLKSKGKTVIFISHRLEEVLSISDEILVLKDGYFQGVIENANKDEASATRKEIIRRMTGTEKGLSFPSKKLDKVDGDAVLSIRNLHNNYLHGIDLDIYKGEIVALAGLDGQGQSLLLRAISGLLTRVEGTIILEGEEILIRDVFDAVRNGIFYVSDRRDEEELWMTHEIWLNISVPSISSRTHLGLIPMKNDRSTVNNIASDLNIEPPSLNNVINTLSGGNRQKVVLGKYLLSKPRILLMDQPTIGLDINAKMEIYHLVRDFVNNGVPVLTVLTDCEEVLNLPDRILVMHEGRIAREFSGEGIDEEELLDSYYG